MTKYIIDSEQRDKYTGILYYLIYIYFLFCFIFNLNIRIVNLQLVYFMMVLFDYKSDKYGKFLDLFFSKFFL